MDLIDLRPENHRAFARGHRAAQEPLAAITGPALAREARRALTEALAAYEAAGDTEGAWQTRGALRALRDHRTA